MPCENDFKLTEDIKNILEKNKTINKTKEPTKIELKQQDLDRASFKKS